jgi:hypothetical protein
LGTDIGIWGLISEHWGHISEAFGLNRRHLGIDIIGFWADLHLGADIGGWAKTGFPVLGSKQGFQGKIAREGGFQGKTTWEGVLGKSRGFRGFSP